MTKRFRLALMTLAVVGLLAGVLAAYGNVNSDVSAQLGSETTPVGIRVTSR